MQNWSFMYLFIYFMINRVILQLILTFCWEVILSDFPFGCFAYNINNFFPLMVHAWR